MWCSYYVGWAQWLETIDEDCLKLETAYKDLAEYLLKNNVEYDYGDEEMLSRLGKVEDGTLVVGNARYKKVVIPQMLTIRSSTLQLLEQFQHCGGKVIVYEDAPAYVDAQPAEVPIGNATRATLLEDRKLVAEGVLSSLRKAEDGRYYIMLLNTDAENAVSANLRLPAGNTEQWDPATGEIITVNIDNRISLYPGEMRLLCVGNNQEEVAFKKELPVVRLKENFRYTTDEPNVLVIDKVTCCVADQTISGDVLKIDRQIRSQLGLPMRGGEMYQPWCIAKSEQAGYFDFELTYTFESNVSCAAFLATEATGIIQVNGQIVDVSGDWWVDACFKKAPIQIQKGRNIITIQDTYTQQQNLEAMYILGEFGVFHGVIDKKPEQIILGDITKQGFPHYSGKFTYIFKQPVKETSVLHFKDLCGAAAIRVNGQLIAWQPYTVTVEPCDQVEVELSLTRRNTFGPLHQLPAVDVVYSPESFVTEGDKWTDEMVVLPCGLRI